MTREERLVELKKHVIWLCKDQGVTFAELPVWIETDVHRLMVMGTPHEDIRKSVDEALTEIVDAS